MKITYEPNYTFNSGGDQYQVCKTLFGNLLDRVSYYTFIPYNFTKQIKSWYEIYAFDCLDEKYQEKLSKLKEVVKDLDTEIIEDEAIFFAMPEDTSGEKLKEIQEKLDKAINQYIAKPIKYNYRYYTEGLRAAEPQQLLFAMDCTGKYIKWDNFPLTKYK